MAHASALPPPAAAPSPFCFVLSSGQCSVLSLIFPSASPLPLPPPPPPPPRLTPAPPQVSVPSFSLMVSQLLGPFFVPSLSHSSSSQRDRQDFVRLFSTLVPSSSTSTCPALLLCRSARLCGFWGALQPLNAKHPVVMLAWDSGVSAAFLAHSSSLSSFSSYLVRALQCLFLQNKSYCLSQCVVPTKTLFRHGVLGTHCCHTHASTRGHFRPAVSPVSSQPGPLLHSPPMQSP